MQITKENLKKLAFLTSLLASKIPKKHSTSLAMPNSTQKVIKKATVEAWSRPCSLKIERHTIDYGMPNYFLYTAASSSPILW